MASRRGIAVVAILVVAGALVAVVAFPLWSGSQKPSASPSPSESVLPVMITPAPSCPMPVTGRKLIDMADGFQLVMPSNWRDLRPGDPGRIILYGADGENSRTVQEMLGGELQAFAVPLEPREDDSLVTLAVFIDPVDEQDLVEEGAAYASIIEGLRGVVISRDVVALPAGDAVRVVGRYPYGDPWDFDMRVEAYMLYHDGARYALVVVSRDVYADVYMPVAECMATSLEFIGPAPTPRPSVSPSES